MKQRILVFLVTALLAAGFSAARPAFAHAGGDNAAIAINTKDGSTVIKIAFAIRHVMGDVVDSTNGAVAYSSCTECTTVAIAIEIVLIQDNASVITPTNVAIAINELCSLCVTVAEAYQFVLTTGGAVHFDAAGNKILARIKNRLERLKHERLTIAELQAELDAIKAQILDVLANHLVRNGPPPKPEPTAPPATTTTTPPETTTTTPTTTSAPTTTATTPTTTATTTTETIGTTTTTTP
jgi:putative peptide zinc metalloprotease protein